MPAFLKLEGVDGEATDATTTDTIQFETRDDGSDARDGDDDAGFGDMGEDWIIGGTETDGYGGWGDDLMNADDVLGATDSTEVEGYPDVAGLFKDTAEGETADDPYSNFNFTVDWGGA